MDKSAWLFGWLLAGRLMRGRGWIKALRQDDARQVRAHCGTGARSHGDQMRSLGIILGRFRESHSSCQSNRQIANSVASICPRFSGTTVPFLRNAHSLSGDAFHAANSATKTAVSPFTDAHLSSPLFPNTIIAVPVTSIDRSAIMWLTPRKKPQSRFCSMFASTAIAAFSGWLRLDMAFKS